MQELNSNVLSFLRLNLKILESQCFTFSKWPGVWMSEPNFDFRPLTRLFLGGTNPVFRNFWFVQRLRVGSSSHLKYKISGSIPNMWKEKKKSVFSTRALDPFWGGPKCFGLFCLSGREMPIVRREAPVFLYTAGGF